jgi:phosphoheptose isomerase
MADPASQSLNDQMMEELVSVTAENTTTLIDVQKQAAATAASVKDARTYIARVAANTDWEANAHRIAAVMEKAFREDRAALNAAAKAADDMQTMSVGISYKVDTAADAQQKASLAFHSASERLLRVMEAHQQGKWRRMGLFVLIGSLCAALGFFAREPATKFQHLWDARTGLKLNAADADCDTLGGQTMPSGDNLACVIWQDTAQGS